MSRPGASLASTAAPRRGWLALFYVAMALVCAALIALGSWQVQRRAWKLDLIQRVDARIHAPPVAAPPPADWPNVTAARDEYRHVSVRGRYIDAATVRVQAVTEVGSGSWLLTPLRRADGSVVLVNRGFVPSGWKPTDASRDATGGDVTVSGLLRMTEPRGGFLRRNDPAADRWYSRDVQAIAAAKRLPRVAPYFIDAERAPAPATSATAASLWPLGGLTVVRFNNNHLVYALTWFGLALMVIGATWRVATEARRRRLAQA